MIRKINILVIILILSGLPLIIATLSFQTSQQPSKELLREGEIKEERLITDLKTSSVWNFTSLIIDDTGATGNCTWAEAVLEDWCSGLGTEESPYLINDIIIVKKTTDTVIEIRNSDAHFQINNSRISYLYNLTLIGKSDIGIKLINCTNGRLTNNYLCGINYSIYLDNCNFTTISENIFDVIQINAITLENSHNNIISQNLIPSAPMFGIYISEDSTHNLISENVISDCESAGISLSSSNNIISGNTINQNFRGVELYGHNNIISENIVNDNEKYGIRLSWGNNITIINNQLVRNSKIDPDNPLYENLGLILDGYSEYAFVNITIFGNVIVDCLIRCFYAKDIVIQKNTISQINFREYRTGFAIQHCENFLLTENIFDRTPIGVGYSNDSRISKNTVKNSFPKLYYSYNISIEENALISYSNLELTHSSNNTITRNTIDVEQATYGIELTEESNYNIITYNKITYDEIGGCIKQDDSCVGNIIENNTCTQRIIPGFDILTLLVISCIFIASLIVIFKKKLLIKMK